ncbi:MAG: hypothetical protein ABIH49_02690 [archaeon]
MIWQDIAISIANILFTYSLVRQVYHGFKKRKGFLTLQSSMLTTIGLYTMFVTMFTLKLYISSAVLFTNASLWLTLFIQRIKFGEA